jgi:DNA adenine methylase
MPYPGGEFREAKRLAEYFPKHDTYVEPFVGGGSFFFYKEPSRKEVIGDTSDEVIPFYLKVRKGGLRKCKTGFKFSRSAFAKAQKGKTACDVLAKRVMGWGGTGKGYRKSQDGKTHYKQKLTKLNEYEQRLRRAHLSTKSFEKTMKKHDGPKTWHLLDPPWPDATTTERWYDGGLTVSPDDVARVCKKMKGIVWVIYNETPEVKRAFSAKKFHIYRIETQVGSATGPKAYRKVLITNRPLKKKPVGMKTLHGLEDMGRPGEHLEGGALTGMAHVIGTLAVSLGMSYYLNDENTPVSHLLADTLAGGAAFWILATIVHHEIDEMLG